MKAKNTNRVRNTETQTPGKKPLFAARLKGTPLAVKTGIRAGRATER